MALKESYDSVDDIPEAYRDLYEEADGKYSFAGVEGMASSAQVSKLRSEAAGYRTKLRETEGRLSKFTAYGDLESIQSKLDKLEELELSSGNKDEAAEKLKEVHQTRLNRQKAEFEAELAKSAQVLAHYEQQAKQQAIKAAVEQAVVGFKSGKVNPQAVEDVYLYAERHFDVEAERDANGVLRIREIRTKDGAGVTPLVDPSVWLGEMLERKPHWLAPSSGGGASGSAGGGGSSNPFTSAAWNKDAQTRIFKELGRDKADQLAKAAGFSGGFNQAAGATKAVR